MLYNGISLCRWRHIMEEWYTMVGCFTVEGCYTGLYNVKGVVQCKSSVDGKNLVTKEPLPGPSG